MKSMPPLDVVSVCRARDFPVWKIAATLLPRYLNVRRLVVIVPSKDVSLFENAVSTPVVVWNEDEILPEMTIASLRSYDHPCFPRIAGWYYQQFLKFAYAFAEPSEDYYLIWDADTVPLRPISLFDSDGRMLFVPADEFHQPYFDTYETLLGEPADYRHSFVSQHQLIQKSVLRELLQWIEQRSGGYSWPWAIVRALPSGFGNFFSEYETYGQYLQAHYPDRMVWRDLPWLRGGTEQHGFPPKLDILPSLSSRYAYVSFESKRTRWRRFKSFLYQLLHAGRKKMR
jgi:hypothetical protein